MASSAHVRAGSWRARAIISPTLALLAACGGATEPNQPSATHYFRFSFQGESSGAFETKGPPPPAPVDDSRDYVMLLRFRNNGQDVVQVTANKGASGFVPGGRDNASLSISPDVNRVGSFKTGDCSHGVLTVIPGNPGACVSMTVTLGLVSIVNGNTVTNTAFASLVSMPNDLTITVNEIDAEHMHATVSGTFLYSRPGLPPQVVNVNGAEFDAHVRSTS